MLILRGSRTVQAVGSRSTSDVTFDLGAMDRRGRGGQVEPWRPPTEVFENARELVVRVEVGGLSKDDLDVAITGGELRIRGVRAVVRPTDQRIYHESRIRYGAFETVVPLPFPVNTEAAAADYVDGFLSVRLPRLAATKLRTSTRTSTDETRRGES